MPDRVTTLLQGGITNAVVGTALETYVGMDPSTVHQYFNDFDTYAAGDWTITQTHAGTNGLLAGNYGLFEMVNLATSADIDTVTLTIATFLIAPPRSNWFKCRFAIADATNSGIILGLQNLNTNAFAATDGIWFYKPPAQVTGNFVVAASSTATTSSAAVTVAASATTFQDVGFFYDGTTNTVNLYAGGSPLGSVASTNLPAATTALALTLAVENGTAAAQTLIVDYVLAAQERDVPSQILGS